MTFYQQARRISRWRTYFIIFIVLFGMVLTVVGTPIMRRLVNPCGGPPTYADDVPQEIREQLDTLYDLDLLYCTEPISDLTTVHDRVYFGSDGVSSVLYFPADSLEGVGVTRYGFGESFGSAFNPVSPGGYPFDGFGEDTIGRPVWTNQAPEGASYFYRFQGAPADTDRVAAVTVKGPATIQTSLTERDVFDDLELFWDWVRRKSPEELGSTSVPLQMPLLPERWMELRGRHIASELVNEEGAPSFRALRDLAPTEPMHYQTLSGPLGTTVWVAGVVTGTKPALVLVPAEGAGDERIEALSAARWVSDLTDVILYHFAFESLPTGSAYEARYWHDPDEITIAPPDYTWTISVPEPAPTNSES